MKKQKNYTKNKKTTTLSIKNPNKKELFILIDNFLEESQNKGCFCYHITTNFTPQSSTDTDENELRKLLHLINKLNDIAFYFLALEYNDKNKLHVHVFFAIKNLIGNNSRIKLNLQKIFINESFIDTNIDECKQFIDKAKAFKYVTKEAVENTSKIFMHAFILNKDWVTIGKFLINFFFDKKINVWIQYLETDKTSNKLIEFHENTKTLSLNNIIALFRLYFEEKNWYINEKNIFETIKDSRMSVKLINKIENIENLYEEIQNWAIKEHALTFQGFDFQELKNKFLKQFKKHFIEDPATIGQVIELSYNLMEFLEGIYIISTDTFLQLNGALVSTNMKAQNVLNVFLKKWIRTVNYYNKTYKRIQKPYTWIENVEKQIINLDKAQEFYIDFAKFFNEDIAKNKSKNTLATVISGQSNSFKTTLTSFILIQFFSLSKIAFTTKSPVFDLEDLLIGDKKILLCNDWFLDPKKISDLLELTSGDAATKIDKKFSAPGEMKKIAILFLTMNFWKQLKKLKEKEDRRALLNRLKRFYFLAPRTLPTNVYKELILNLKNEIPNIVIFCNKLAKQKQKKNIRTIWNTVKPKEKLKDNDKDDFIQ